MVRIRKSVWKLGNPSPELQWYAKAVAAMKARKFSDPKSWTWQGAVHGYVANLPPWPTLVAPPQPHHKAWEQCQHQTWFFLPWHRGYLACFEAIVADTVHGLGGPADWALPYWDYAAGTADARKLPRAFLHQSVGGQANPLWSPRRPDFDSNPNYQIPASIVSAAKAMANPTFTSTGMGVPTGFGGPQTGFMHYGGAAQYVSGDLEQQPHNLVHDAISGLMGDPDTAGLDPIFWLHHANIDRLWQKWIEKYGTGNLPTSAAWLSKIKFPLYNAQGPWSFTAADTIDTRQLLHGYAYDDQKPAVPLKLDNLMAERREPKPGEPVVIGASRTNIPIEEGRTTVKVRLAAPRRAPSMRQAIDAVERPPRTFLKVDDVKNLPNGTILRVMVTPPDGGQPVEAGFVSAFASKARGDGGAGSSHAFDVTEALARPLTETAAPAGDLDVHFEQELPPSEPPVAAPTPVTERFDALRGPAATAAAPPTAAAPASIGRVSLVRG